MRLQTEPVLDPPMAVSGLIPDANYLNVHSITIVAEPAEVWSALLELPSALRHSPVARVITIPLLVAAIFRRDFRRIQGPWLALRPVREEREALVQGQHRYASFAANVCLEPDGPARTRVYNVTRARFSRSGLGSIYLLGVHLFHDLYIEWLLHALKQAVEADKTAGRGAAQ